MRNVLQSIRIIPLIRQTFFNMPLEFRIGPLLATVTKKLVSPLADDDRKTRIVIVFSMQIVAPDERRTALLRALGAMLGPTRVTPGCLDARLYSDLDRRKTLLLVEDWETREQFERNLDMAKLNAIVAAIELSNEAPVVRVDAVEREEGVDALALHRSVASSSGG
jgi:quinol monooxygenase YgiN